MHTKVAEVEIVKLGLKAGDTVVLTHPQRYSDEGRKVATAAIEALLPEGVKVLILDGGMQMTAVLTSDDFVMRRPVGDLGSPSAKLQ